MHCLKVAPSHNEAENSLCLVKKLYFHSGTVLLLIFTFFTILKAGKKKWESVRGRYLSENTIFWPNKRYFQLPHALEQLLRNAPHQNIFKSPPPTFTFDEVIQNVKQGMQTSIKMQDLRSFYQYICDHCTYTLWITK